MLIKLADFSTNAFCLHRLRDEAPQRYAKLVRKYRPCVAMVRERLLTSAPDDVFFPIRDQVLAELESAWTRDYAMQ
jgi:hypothetical protein